MQKPTISQIKISELIESKYNPRQLSKKAESELTNSIKKFGLVDPIIINSAPNRKNIIIGGHQRYKIAKK